MPRDSTAADLLLLSFDLTVFSSRFDHTNFFDCFPKACLNRGSILDLLTT